MADNKPEGTILSGFVDEAQNSDEAIQVNDHVYISKDMGDSILIVTDDKDVVINTGLPGSGGRHRARFSRVSSNPIGHIVLTQCHANQFGGAEAMRDPATKIIAQARYPECRQYWMWLDEFYRTRSGKLWGDVLGKSRPEPKNAIVEARLDILFDDSYRFESGGRQFELYATPGGESLDALIVWLPKDRTAIVGNLFGPIFGHIPNLSTLRGDKIRSAVRYMQSIDRVLALQPKLLITGHEVIDGADQISTIITRLREAVKYLHEKTIEGMNAGKTVHTLMAEITLPEQLKVGEGHGKVPWCIRAIWEEYAGWFHYDSTTALYHVPGSSVAGDITELAGGVEKLAGRAQHYIANGQPLEAIHLIDIALSAEPDNRVVLQAKLDAHQQLLNDSGGENFSETMWLKSEIGQAEKALEALQSA